MAQKYISLIQPEWGGTSGEVFLFQEGNEKKVLRRCLSDQRKELYLESHSVLADFDFLPKLIWKESKDLFFEFVEGRDGRKDDLFLIKEAGRILGLTHTSPHRKKIDILGELDRNLRCLLDQKIISSLQFEKVKKICSKIKDTDLTTLIEIVDLSFHNFRVGKDIKFVDIQGIKPNLKGTGIAHAFLRWAKSQEERELFLEGYACNASLDFWTKEYKEFCYLVFLSHKISKWHKQGRSDEEYLNFINMFYHLVEGRLE